MKAASSLATAILVILSTILSVSLINATLEGGARETQEKIRAVEAKLTALKVALGDMDLKQYELLLEKGRLLNEIAELRAELDSRPSSIRRLMVTAEAVTAADVREETASGSGAPSLSLRLDAGARAVRPGGVAVSPDLLERGWTIGRKAYVEDLGVFEIFDVLPAGQKRRLRLLVDAPAKAARFGVQVRKVTLLE